MISRTEYDLEWELDESKGQVGLLTENHYRPLFAFPQQRMSFRPEDVWLDIGANIGAFAIRAAKLVKEVVAVEPERDNIDCLQRNIAINHVQNITVLREAVVGGDQKTVPLALSNTFSSTHRVGKIRGRKSVDVAAVNINDLIHASGANKIKIDAEGSEAEILEAMQFVRVEEIVFEYHFAFLKDTDWSRFYAILDRLRSAGFDLLKAPAGQSKTWHTIVWAKRPS